MMLFVHIIASFFSTVAFGVLTNIPRRALLASGITGCIGWLIYVEIHSHGGGLGVANFLATFVIGCFSIFFSRKKRIPMIIFNIPSLVPLVPGGPAYKAVRELVLGNNTVAFENIMIVMVTAGSIASAFMMTSLVERIIIKWKKSTLHKKFNKKIN
ncbi:threonine/serine exporter family protein [Enterococcus saccharolyticus]|uniref:threonine/serine exporter family protein n=1 Tax=Enterococcus saccharolyticus TaxID=41997 RepID=UPI0039E1146C